MQDDLNNRPRIGNRATGIGGGTIAAIIAAVLIIGALFMWGPWNTNSGTASNKSATTTTGSARTTSPVAPATAPSTTR